MDDVTRGTMQMLNAAIDARMPVMLVGAPGTGKTATVKQIAREREGYELITLVGSRMDPTDVAGLPKAATVHYGEDQKPVEATVYLSPAWEVEILQKRKVILFLDEWSNSSSAVQASFLTILQEREFPNGHKFPDETIIVGAMNPADEAADGYEMSLPTSNRIFWISWNPAPSAWLEGMATAWGQEVPAGELDWKKKIAKFIKDNPSFLHQPPGGINSTEAFGLDAKNSSDMEVARYAWASRRSWDNLSRVLANVPNDNIYVQDSCAQGIVGFSAATRFREWLQEHDNIDPQEVMDDPHSIDWKEITVGDITPVFRALAEMVDAENSEKILNVFKVCAEEGRAAYAASYIKDVFGKAMSEQLPDAVRKRNRAICTQLVPLYDSVTKRSTAKQGSR